jgi:hypothetical protein
MTSIEITHEMELQAKILHKELITNLPIPTTFEVRIGDAAGYGRSRAFAGY